MRQRANDPSRRQLERACGWAGLVLALGCGSRTGLELGRGGNGPAGGSGGVGGFGAAGGSFATGGLGTGAIGSGAFGTGGFESGRGTGGVPVEARAPDLLLDPPAFCTIDGWCGSNADFVAISGTSPVDIWIVARDTGDIDDSPQTLDPSEHTALLHWTGLRWDVWPLDPSQLEPGVSLRSIWAGPGGDVWAVGDAGSLLHFDGEGWAPWSAPVWSAWSAVSGTGPSDVWAVGTVGAKVHFNGSSWDEVPSTSMAELTSVWALPGATWFVDAGEVFRRSGVGDAVYDTGFELTDVWAVNDREAFAVGHQAALAHFNDDDWEVWSESGSSDEYSAVWGRSSTDVWAVGPVGKMAHYAGGAWALSNPPTDENLNGVWGVDGFTWAVGDHGTFLELKDDAWQSSQPTTKDLRAIWGAAPNDVWAAGDDFLHWDGQVWEQVPDPAEAEVVALWGAGVSDVWAVGPAGTIVRFDGMSWRSVESPSTADLNGVWGGAADDVWVVSELGEGWHFDGADWELRASGPTPWKAVWGDDLGQAVFLGSNSVLRRVDGTLTPVANPNESATYTLAFGNGEHIWLGGMVPWGAYKAGGAYPELTRSDGLLGLTFDLEPTGPYGLSYNPIQAGWGFASDDVWVALPFVEHWDGKSWSASSVGGSESVRALFGTTTDVWALTDTSGIVRRSR